MGAPGAAEALAEIVALLGDPGPEPDVGRALDLLAGATGARRAAVYLGDPTAGGLELRALGGPGGREEGGPEGGIRAAAAPGVCAALLAGREVDARGPLADELAELGLSGGRLLPARLGGRTVAALGLAPAAADVGGRGDAALLAVAHLLGLALRNGQLAAGVRDRVRELDRQAAQLDALTRVAGRVAAALEPAEAHAVVAAEARALARADVAVLLLPGPDGALHAVAADGEGGAPQDEEVALAAASGEARGRGRRAAVPLPPAGPGGGPVGVIAVQRARGRAFDADDLERLRGLAGQAAIALANAGLLGDLRRERDERRALVSALVLAQEQERRRIAEEIHDGPVQELVGVGLLLDALASDLGPAAPGAAEEAEQAAAAAREAVRGLRRAIADLHPLVLERLGFAAAVRSMLERLGWSEASADVQVAAAERLPEPQRTVAFRIVQEAVANATRHADARRVGIRARDERGEVVIEVADDGRGFDPAAPRTGPSEGHLGLAAIEERARLAGGALEVAAAPGRGTTVRLRLPADEDGQAGGDPSRSSAAASASSSAKRSSTTT